MKHGQQLIKRLGLALLGLIIGLLSAEAVCKIIDLRTARQRLEATRKISRRSSIPGIRYELIPGARGITPGHRQEIRVNNLGFRGPDVNPEKPAGVLRIAVIGDSITFGRPYPEDLLFPRILETRLNRRFPDLRFEVINAGLSGRDTWEERALLEQVVLPLSPDLVILQICLNDHIRLPPLDSRAAGAFGERPWYTYSSLLALLDDRMPGFRSAHVNVLQRLGLDARSPEQLLLDQVISPTQMLAIERDWPAWSAELLRFHESARSGGAAVLFLVFPIRWQLDHGCTSSSLHLARLTRDAGIPMLDMIHTFQANPERFLRDYTHPTPSGHMAVALEIERVIAAYLSPSPS